MDKKIRKHIIIEYVLKVAIPVLFFGLFYLVANTFGLFGTPEILGWIWIIFYIVAYYWYISLPVYILILFVPFTKREGSFFKKYILPPLVTIGIIGGIIGLVFGVIFAYQGVGKLGKYISDRQTGAEIDAFIDRSDETLVYIYPINGEEYYPNGIYYSSVKTSSVFIDYDTKEVAFVVYVWGGLHDKYFTCQLEQTEYKTRNFRNFYEESFEAPDIGTGYYFQSYTELNSPGQLLYTYGTERKSNTTNGVALIMRDGTMWVGHFEPTELSLGNSFGFDLCHDGEQQKIEDQILAYAEQKRREWNEDSN